MPALKQTGKRGGKKRKVDTPNCNVRCWPFVGSDSVLENMMPFGDIMQENWATLNVFLCGEFRLFFFSSTLKSVIYNICQLD